CNTPGKIFSAKFFPCAEMDAANFSNDSIILQKIPKTDFMRTQSRIYAKYLCSSFPLIPSHAILEALFVALFTAKSTFRMLRSRPPAAGPRWGVVQPVGHLTVNEDGEGSNPSAPANFSSEHPVNNGSQFSAAL